MGARVFVWIGGALFVASLGVCAWTYLVVLGRPMPAAGWRPLASDAALITVFALHHSLFARDSLKAWVGRHVSAPLRRSVYVWAASLLLILACALWRSVGGECYRATGVPAVALVAVQLAGVWITARGVARVDPLDLAGIRPQDAAPGLQVAGAYRWVRHPLYLGWTLAAFGTPHMTGDRLAFAAFTTTYLVIAIPWEERSLLRSFGDEYARYQRDVRWRMIPFIY